MLKFWNGLAIASCVTGLAAIGCGSGDQASQGYVPVPSDDGGGGSATVSSGVGGQPPTKPTICPDASDVFEVEPAPSNLLILLDRSGSMHLRIDEQNTRWSLTKAGLGEILKTLPSDTAAGLAMFPSGDQPISCCEVTSGNYISCNCTASELPGPEARCEAAAYDEFAVDVAPLSAVQAEKIMASVAASDEEFYWGTPLAAALAGSLDRATKLNLDGVTSVVLLTDGLPTSCHTSEDPDANDVALAIDAVTDGLNSGVRTYVVGIDGEAASSDPATDLAVNLSVLAEAGGTATSPDCAMDDSCAYLVNVDNFEAALSSALGSIALEAASCTFELPMPSGGTPDYDAVNITVATGSTNHTIPRDKAHHNGWDYLPAKDKVQLYGSACELLKADAEAKVVVVVGCKTIEN
ncbi:MAG: hypothetical protein VB934_03360 [Polyangiaceae bacterium]